MTTDSSPGMNMCVLNFRYISSLIGQASVSMLVPNFHTANSVIIEPQYETTGQCYLCVLMTVTAIGYRTVPTRVVMCIELIHLKRKLEATLRVLVCEYLAMV